MKFLLVAVNAKYIHSNLAVYSLKKFADNVVSQVCVEIAEYTINQEYKDILSDIYQKKPTQIALSCYIWNSEIVQKLVVDIHNLLPDIPIWLGGPEVSYNPQAILTKLPMVRGIMTGEGEESFRDLVLFYNGNIESLESIAGLCLQGSSVDNPRKPMNLDDIPFVYSNLSEFEHRIIYYESSRGCPFRCSYCLSSIDKSLRFRSMDKVKRELDFFLENKVRQVKFIDRTFNADPRRSVEIWKYIHEHDNGVTNFHFEIAADILTDLEFEILSKLRVGQVQLEIGVQTTNNETIRAINRRMDFVKVALAVKRLSEPANIHLHLDLIAGLPHEDYSSFACSFNDVYNLNPDELQLGFLKVLSGTQISFEQEVYNIRSSSFPPYEVLSTPWLSYDEILRLKSCEEVLDLYYNSKQFSCTLRYLHRLFDTPFKLYEMLGEYFKSNYTFSSSRVARFELLYNFAREQDPENIELYQEALSYDFYSRDTQKSRPVFFRVSDTKEIRRELGEKLPIKEAVSNKMHHIESFYYKVWAGEMIVSDTATVIYFDYSKRDPISNNCRVSIFKIGE